MNFKIMLAIIERKQSYILIRFIKYILSDEGMYSILVTNALIQIKIK